MVKRIDDKIVKANKRRQPKPKKWCSSCGILRCQDCNKCWVPGCKREGCECAGTEYNYGKREKSIYLNPDMDEINAAWNEESMVNLPMVVKKGSKAYSGNGQGAFHMSSTPTTNVPVGGMGGFHGSGYMGAPACTHDGSALVFEMSGKKLFGSSWNGLREYSGNWDLIIDLAGNVKPPEPPSQWNKFVGHRSTVAFVDELDKFVCVEPPKVLGSELLSLNWADMGAPPVDLPFWLLLWDKLPATTVVACMGGHGRTGTCLAALMISQGMDFWSALETVRKEHCAKAVESLEQEKYLHKLYVERLQWDLAVALSNGKDAAADELKDDIKYAKENKPTATNTTATKAYSYSNVTSNDEAALFDTEGDAYLFYGAVVETKVMSGKTFEQRCTQHGCMDYNCRIINHLTWVEKVDGKLVPADILVGNTAD